MHDKPVSTLVAPADVTFATIQSLDRRPDLAALYFERNPDCVLVIDEAHHAAAKSYRDLIHVATNRRPRVELLGLTATPTRTDKSEIAHLKKLFPNGVLYQVEMADLIEQGILSTPYCRTVKTNQNFDRTFTAQELRYLDRFGELSPSMLSRIGRSTARNKLIADHFIANRSEYGQTLIFATNIAHCYSLSELLKKKGIRADYIASARHDGQINDDVLNRYRGGDLDVLVSVEMLTEGVDLPRTKTVFLARPTGSEILMRQMVGRALRGERAGGLPQAWIVSFADHWERFPDWLDPIALVGPGPLPPDGEKAPRFPVELTTFPWELISAISELAPDIDPVAVLGGTPIGWYKLEKGSPETGRATSVLVYEHQLQAFDRFIKETQKGWASLKGPGGPVARYFPDVPDPVPSIATLTRLAHYVKAFGRPTFVSFEEKKKFDPFGVAKKYSRKPPNMLRDNAIAIFDSNALVQHLYVSRERYVDAVFDALREIMAKPPRPIDQIIENPLNRKWKFPPSGNWPLEQILLEVRVRMRLRRKPVPSIRWSKRINVSLWGLYRARDNLIIINAYLKTTAVSRSTIEFLVYHELLHHELGVEAGHNIQFREAERLFPGYADAEAELDTLLERFRLPSRMTECPV